jgi:SAM-dependent methyltransferase
LESIVREIRSHIQAIENDAALYEEVNFSARVEALDSLEFDVIERVEGLLLTGGRREELAGLIPYAEVVKRRLDGVNERLFRRLRGDIASRNYTRAGLRRQIVRCAGGRSGGVGEGDASYDDLDAFTNGLLLIGPAPEETREREPEMVFYQPTPARIVLELVEKAGLGLQDVFYDIGSGLGQVAILVHLLSGVRAKGVEFEPAYSDYARRCAKELNLSQVEFITADARQVDYADGTVFFLYTPFQGRMLEQVLERLRDRSRTRGIRLYTYGPCTREVARQSWLERLDRNGSNVYRLAIFQTVGWVEARNPALAL